MVVCEREAQILPIKLENLLDPQALKKSTPHIYQLIFHGFLYTVRRVRLAVIVVWCMRMKK